MKAAYLLCDDMYLNSLQVTGHEAVSLEGEEQREQVKDMRSKWCWGTNFNHMGGHSWRNALEMKREFGRINVTKMDT